ncbi:nucleotidyltransferase domain-containing protein [Halobacillus litoralis]|uniref:nucleotidyltransferase domain-containing protein n=1 Tax=Halobacillus litoralis TaxID=45668 RepID=UPI001CD5D13B|nr:nucleotidyltransferase domain-containing protein [Halobacillus litoralis]MCA0972217.1 nucleotidyltransferase domain-containing protein [Halobacillus litoralis]
MIPNEVSKDLRLLGEKYKLEKVMVFGSRARGDHDDRSDVDLAIVAPNLSPSNWLHLLEDIEGLETLLKFDVVCFTQASDSLKDDIIACYRTIYRM